MHVLNIFFKILFQGLGIWNFCLYECSVLSSNSLNFIDIFSIQQGNLLLKMLFDVFTNFHVLFRVNQVDGYSNFS